MSSGARAPVTKKILQFRKSGTMKYTPNQVRVGGWLVSIYKAINCYDLDDPAFEEYDSVIVSARTAEFLSSIRSLGALDGEKFEIYRKLARLKQHQIVDILKRVQSLGAIDVRWKTDGGASVVSRVTSLVTTKEEVLAAAAMLFEELQPSEKARLAVALLDSTVHLPVREGKVIADLVKAGFSEARTKAAIEDLVGTELLAKTEETESGDHLLYNPHVFQKNAADAHKALSVLTGKDQEHALKLLEHVRRKPGIPFPASADKRIVALLAKSGIIDISGVQLRSGTTLKEFPTAPDAWGVFTSGRDGALSKDLVDDSKLLLNSLRYGELYSPPRKGRINDPSVLVEALIKKGQVGPATAIGNDYPLPLARGIVSITESRIYPGRFYMELRKSDIAEAVRDVLSQNAILPVGDVVPPDALQKGGGSFCSPLELRARKPLPKDLIEVRDNMAFELRTYRKRT